MENNDVVTETINVMESTDYKKFKIMNSGNREIKIRYRNIVKSIEKNGFVGSPIIVNELFEIIDGQHRFKALKELKMPIKYFIKHGYGALEVSIINLNGQSMNAKDIVNMRDKMGCKNSIIINNLISRSDISNNSDVKNVLTYSSISYIVFGKIVGKENMMLNGAKNINFDINHTEKVFKMINKVRIAICKTRSSFKMNDRFVKVLVDIFNNPPTGFDYDHLVKMFGSGNVNEHINGSRTLLEIKKMIMRVYVHGSSSKSKHRSVTFLTQKDIL